MAKKRDNKTRYLDDVDNDEDYEVTSPHLRQEEGNADDAEKSEFTDEGNVFAVDKFSTSLYALVVDYGMDESMALLALENSCDGLQGALDWIMNQQRAASAVGIEELVGGGYAIDDSNTGDIRLGGFDAFGDDSDSSTSSSSDGEGEEGEGRGEVPLIPTIAEVHLEPPTPEEEEAVLDSILDAYILENQQLLNSAADGGEGGNDEDDGGGKLPASSPPPPPPSLKPGSKQNIHKRLQSKLVARGITPSWIIPGSADEDGDSIGKTLMQQILEAGMNEIESRLSELRAHERERRLMAKEMSKAKGTSKALPGQYVRKQEVADDTRKRANIHHAGSHYHMAAGRGQMHGKKKGLVARHSSQGSRLQATRMACRAGLVNAIAARDVAKGVIGGENKGKTAKKSSQKKKGKAGGSKKGGGGKGGGGKG